VLSDAAHAIPESAFSTWGVMAFLLVLCLLLSRHLKTKGVGKLESMLEMFMEQLCALIRDIVRSDPRPYVPLAGTLFLFVFTANLVGTIPGLSSPTADLSVTAGLAVVVFFSVPFYGVGARGLRAYLKAYLQPNAFMLPFNVLGELTRTLSLAIRLFGNIMSGEFLLLVVIGVVTTVLRGYARVFMPMAITLTLFLSILGLITAVIQAYIFTVLALVYIGAAVERRNAQDKRESLTEGGDKNHCRDDSTGAGAHCVARATRHLPPRASTSAVI
jgi:F-type H+-transporting ATPase subunit a